METEVKLTDHMVPEGSSDEPLHHIDPSCWCHPRNDNGTWVHQGDRAVHLVQVGDQPLEPLEVLA